LFLAEGDAEVSDFEKGCGWDRDGRAFGHADWLRVAGLGRGEKIRKEYASKVV
jgi:hypothetical protein